MSGKPRKRRQPSEEMLEDRHAASTVEGAEAHDEREKELLAAKERQRKKEVNRRWVVVLRGGAPQ